MKKAKILSIFAVLVASFIQVGCGNQNQNGLQNSQYLNQSCPYGQTFINGVCTGYTNGVPTTGNYNGYNTGYNTGTSCTQGPSYAYTGGTYGSCQPGYVLQGLTCVCQSNTLNQNTGTTTGTTQGGCMAGYISTPYGCYQQGPCRPGDAFITPYGMCYHVGY